MVKNSEKNGTEQFVPFHSVPGFSHHLRGAYCDSTVKHMFYIVLAYVTLYMYVLYSVSVCYIVHACFIHV